MSTLLNKLSNLEFLYEEDQKKFIYRHPQYFQRKMIIYKSKNQKIQFSRVSSEFCRNWSLNRRRLTRILTDDEETQLIQEFFHIEDQHPPKGSPKFEEVLMKQRSMMIKICHKFDRKWSYELNFDDLWSHALIKLYDCWIKNGNKDEIEFRKIFSTSLINKFHTLTSKHCKTIKRGINKFEVPIDDYINIIPDLNTPNLHIENMESYHEKLKQFSTLEQYLINEILNPSSSTQMGIKMDFIRFKRVKSQGVERVDSPHLVTFNRLAGQCNQSVEVLQNTFKSLLSKLNLPANLFKWT